MTTTLEAYSNARTPIESIDNGIETIGEGSRSKMYVDLGLARVDQPYIRHPTATFVRASREVKNIAF
jgi:hypothetical protein